jgi:hypothetical protein
MNVVVGNMNYHFVSDFTFQPAPFSPVKGSLLCLESPWFILSIAAYSGFSRPFRRTYHDSSTLLGGGSLVRSVALNVLQLTIRFYGRVIEGYMKGMMYRLW